MDVIKITVIVLELIRGQCPINWHNDGVRRDGAFECRPRPIGDDHRNARGILVDDSCQPPGRIAGRIHCDISIGEHPVVVDDRAVGCRVY